MLKKINKKGITIIVILILLLPFIQPIIEIIFNCILNLGRIIGTNLRYIEEGICLK